MPQALYYPFSRCVDACALKQLLLVFDGVTFLDPVEESEWRARLFRDLEQHESRFRGYRDLEAPLTELHDEGAIVIKRPKDVAAIQSTEATESILSDLADPVWCGIASKPGAFGMPYKTAAGSKQATWQVFADKLPRLFQNALLERRLGTHLVEDGGDRYSWSLSYEAGSAAALNVHLAAAGELRLAPVTDSSMHHRLLMRKIVRSITPSSEWEQPKSQVLEVAANRTAMQLVDELLPRQALQEVSFKSILRFRSQTREMRGSFVSELERRLATISIETSLSEISAQQTALSESLRKEIRDYRGSLQAARDKVWPGLVRGTTTAMAGGTLGAVALQLLAGGPYGVLAGSIVGASLGVLQTALDQRAEVRKAEVMSSPSVAYLSRVAALA